MAEDCADRLLAPSCGTRRRSVANATATAVHPGSPKINGAVAIDRVAEIFCRTQGGRQIGCFDKNVVDGLRRRADLRYVLDHPQESLQG